jgi:hypothetical protein
MPVMGAVKFERFFRQAVGLDVDHNDLKRYDDFVNSKLNDMQIVAFATAKWNGRDIVAAPDLPVTAGLQHSMHEFRRFDEEIELLPLLEQLAALSPNITLSDEAGQRVPLLAGGLSVALGHTIRILRPEIKRPHAELWERAFRVVDLLL